MSSGLIRRRLYTAVLGVGLAWGLAGCDDPPSGRFYSGSVQTELGAPCSALLVFMGEGLIGVEGTGGTLGWAGAVSGDPGEMRVLLIDPDPSGAMTFRLLVEDPSTPRPTVSVLQLMDRQNEWLQAEQIRIPLER
jgi:hypothetical protein